MSQAPDEKPMWKFPLSSFRVKKFKVVQDSNIKKFIPLRFWLVFVK
jgi:hypothetical protein